MNVCLSINLYTMFELDIEISNICYFIDVNFNISISSLSTTDQHFIRGLNVDIFNQIPKQRNMGM